MRIYLIMGAIYLMVFMASPVVQAQQKTGVIITASYLYEVCTRDVDGGEVVRGGHTACQAYIAGVVDYHNLLRTLGTEPSINICVPNTAKPRDLQDIVWSYLDKNAQHDAFAAAPAVTLALSKVFPCKKN